MRLTNVSVPWGATLSNAEHQLIFYFLVVAALAFVAGFIRTYITRNEVGSRYRTAVSARLGMLGVALLAYILIIVAFLLGYDSTAGGWVPNDGAINIFSTRYIEWTVSVPLLTIELLAVCATLGVQARRNTAIAVTATGAMIFCGFLGAIVIDNGTNTGAFILWAVISCVFWVIANVVLIRAVRQSLPTLTPESHTMLKSAAIVLLAGWVVYPIVYFLPLFGASGGLTTTILITLTVADVIVKLGFSTQTHRVAKLRTAEDVRAGDDVHPESIWISSVKQSDAGLPREVYLAEGAAVHDRRTKPPTSAAVASPEAPLPPDSTPLDGGY
ncbi:bacteriorhodopsin [Subtercola endophyticus]|uniref:Cryorhodopsin CryoR2 n=3 Tax=Subtercola TaxID=120212 RepID=A0ABF7PQ05_9MICO|nr:bacteriorhodopsin [Subtercola endophyticus]UFS59673.1 bacteriorhodopsin [Subtercola endophyticus]